MMCVVDAGAPYPLAEVHIRNQRSSRVSVGTGGGSHRRLLGAIRRSRATLLYVSSFVTLARPRGIAERAQDAALRLIQPYFEVKELIESMVLQSTRRGLRTVIVNPILLISARGISVIGAYARSSFCCAEKSPARSRKCST